MKRYSREWRIASLPRDVVKPGDFQLARSEVPALKEGEALVRVLMMGLDAGMLLYVTHSHLPAVVQHPGDIMGGFGIGEILESRSPDFKIGDLVSGRLCWQEFAVLSAGELQKSEPGRAMQHSLSLFNFTGLTAYYGIRIKGELQPGQTVVISAAAGGVGSIAGQIARILGCRTIGIVGGTDKVAWIKSELGYDHAIDYKSEPVGEALARLCPSGADIYFDNVGGHTLAAVSAGLKQGGRIMACGFISEYLVPKSSEALSQTWWTTIYRGLTVVGFNIGDFLKVPGNRERAERELDQWVAEGRLKPTVQVLHGFTELPNALSGVFAGRNRGKVVIQY